MPTPEHDRGACLPRYERKHVIGGTSGMGLATAQLIHDEGASVLVTGRSSAAVETARDPIDTGIVDRSMFADAAASLKLQMTANNSMGRFGSPEEIARAVAFLAFEATFTTGAELAVDGGVSQLV